MTKIDKIYQALLNIVSDLGYLGKAQTTIFETHPAIGFDVPIIENIGELGNNNKINIDIPVVIVDAGIEDLVNVNLAVMYEEFRSAFFTNIIDELDDLGVTVELIDFGNFQPRQNNQEDIAECGIEGTVGFRLEL